MSIWNWRKKNDDVILDCYTYNPYVYNFAKINYGYHFLPEWWKKTPKNRGSGNDTIKNCPAIVEYYKKSIALRTNDWSKSIYQTFTNHSARD